MANIRPVLLTHGYFIHDDPKEQVVMKPYPPLGILYLSAWLDQHNIENDVFDTTFSSFDALSTHLLHTKPRIVALYTNLMTKINVIRIIRFIKSQPALQDVLIVLGGPDVTHNTSDYLHAGAGLLVLGEGEQTMLEIAQAYHTPKANISIQYYDIQGLAFLLEDGSVYKTNARAQLRELDELPVPNRKKINLQAYLDVWKNAHGYSAISLSTQRGCPYTCRWCSTAVYGQSYRRRSPKAVADEIEALQQVYSFDLIWFVDDVFTVSHKWVREFCEVLKSRNMQIRFECITRADRMSEEVVALLKDSGCYRIWIGAESGSQRIIDAMDRRVDVVQVRSMIQATRKAGMEAGTFIMLGYPGETEADIRLTVEHLKAANPHLFTITVAYPIKGTGLYEEVQSTAHTDLPWEESTDRDIQFKRTYPRRYYDYAVRWAVNAVQFHQARLKGQHISSRGTKLWLKASLSRAGMWWWRRQGA